MLATQTPGGLYEGFFEEAGEPTNDDVAPPAFEARPDEGRAAEIAARYGIEIPLRATRGRGMVNKHRRSKARAGRNIRLFGTRRAEIHEKAGQNSLQTARRMRAVGLAEMC